jgi:serine/threonine protein kinase
VQVHIGDFGLSKSQSAATGATGAAPLSPGWQSGNGKAMGDAGPGIDFMLRSHTSGVGSPLYCSPEQLSGKSYSERSDIFSLGVIFAEMHFAFQTQAERVITLSKLRNFPSQGEQQIPRSLLPSDSGGGAQLDERGLRFVSRLLRCDPSERPSSSAVLQDEYLVETLRLFHSDKRSD